MSWVARPCPNCGGTPVDGSGGRSFVTYEPAPSDIQQEELEWTDDLEPLNAFMCVDCGTVIGVIDTKEPELDRGGSEFRVDRPLE